MVCHGFDKFWYKNVGCPLASSRPLCRPVPPNRNGLDPPDITSKISDSGGLDLES
jgi:hypothetical protein